ncbi:NAC domain-containing protein 41-like [Gastrolobium bilobum]|uniref:NAC domain-containing protein 41-like n=1 Tax=Gastrolobium bilobum TaxID=150636 RepID=UPI002AB13266|nr:NAC domain-containing protein 41-like [Gastrolobium bilobum]
MIIDDVISIKPYCDSLDCLVVGHHVDTELVLEDFTDTDLMALISCSRKEFKPTDDELIQLFLYNKVNGKPLPRDVTILEYDLYGEKNPWEIWEAFGDSNSYGGTDIYFFTTLKKKFSSGTRSVRTIGCGSWEAEDKGKKVMANGTMQCIGIRRRLRFEKNGTNHDGAWILHEYRLDSSLLHNGSADNYVLCRFRKNLRHDLHKKQGVKRIRQKDFTVKQTRKTVVLELEAPTTHVDRTNEVEISKRTELVYKEKEDDGLTMTWPHLFSMQMREANGVLVQEEEIQMLPNTFYNEFLLERLSLSYL